MTDTARRVPQWGLLGVLGTFAAWFLGGIIASVAVVAVGGSERATSPLGVVAVLVGQSAAALVALAVVSFTRGQSSFARDFGLRARFRDLAWLPAGVALQLVGLVAMYPLVQLSGRGDTDQQLVTTIRNAPMASQLLLVVGVVVLVPITEELLFRGALLRALLRHISVPIAVLVDALLFGFGHLFDPNAIFGLPSLVVVGIVAAWLAIRNGRIGPSIALHAGFNFAAVLLIFLT